MLYKTLSRRLEGRVFLLALLEEAASCERAMWPGGEYRAEKGSWVLKGRTGSLLNHDTYR